MIELEGVGKSIIDVIEKQVELHHSDEALLLENGTSYTYAALDAIATDLSRNIAHCMSQLGDLDMGDNNTPLVTVIMNRGVGIAAVFLAILKAGCAYVPVDPSFPPNRQSYIMKQSRSHLLIIDPENMSLAQSLGVKMPPTLVVNGSTGALSSENALNFPLPEDGFAAANAKLLVDRAAARERPQGGLAYILFTSGSTGNPKGCVAHNQSALSQLQAFGTQLNVKAPKPGDSRSHRFLGLATFSFDISVLELFVPLVHGTTSLMAFSSTQRDSFRLKEILDTMQVDVMQATPTTYEMLLAVGWKGRADIQLLVGGEAFRPSLLPLVLNCHSMFNLYGPTETTMWASTYLVPKNIRTFNPTIRGVSCGLPLPGVKFYIANREDYTQLLDGDDVEGELVIGGVGANSGRYIHEPDLTSAVFHLNPYGDPGRVYQSGDVFRRKKIQYQGVDGSLVDSYSHIFVSRNDDQVKIDGFRIELEEIERVFLHSAPEKCVDVCVAIVRNKKLILYIKPKPARETDLVNVSNDLIISQTQIEEMKKEAAKSLMYYMMPLHYITVQSFPVTPGFKIDRKALPDPPEWAELAALSTENNCPLLTQTEYTAKLPCGVDVVRSHAGYWDPENHSDSIDSDEEDVTEGQPLSMLQHVISIVYRARGVRPSANSNFVSIGVDSLGAIFFLTLLSESLGGVRIKPQEMFAQGVTLESFSKQLLTKLIVENPTLLQELHITADFPNIDEKSDDFDTNNTTTQGVAMSDAYDDAEKGCSCLKMSTLLNLRSRICGADSATNLFNAVDESTLMSADALSPVRTQEDEEISKSKQEKDRIGSAWTYESSFEDEYSNICASNLPMLDGLRCVFTFIVLFDHFWSNTSWDLDNGAIGASIQMFLLVTGWGTALILREPEKLRFQTVTRWFKKDTKSAAEEQVRGYLVLRRAFFNWRSFLLTRFVGLFPVLWLALLLMTPMWLLQDKLRREQTEAYYSLSPADRPTKDPMDLTINGYAQTTNGVICSALYVTGLNAFYRPQCRSNGPNALLFASIIWGLFLLWIVPKILWVWIQEKLMRWGLQNNISEKDFTNLDDVKSGPSTIVGVTNTDSAQCTECKPILHKSIPEDYIANDSIFDSTGDSLFCQVPSINAPENYSHKEYFRALFFRMTYNRPNGFRELLYFTACATVFMSLLMAFRGPWQMKNSVIFLPDFLAGYMGAAILECYCYARFVARKRDIHGSALHAWFGIDFKVLSESELDISHNTLRLRAVLDFCQTFLPDFSWMLFFFILSDATPTLREATSGFGYGGADTYRFILWIWIELLVLLLLFSYFTQEKSTSGSFSRYLLSTRISSAIGHSSYVTYLLQRPGIDVWGPSFSYFFQSGKWRWNHGKAHWFEWTPNIWKFCGIAVLIFCCWLIQVYFQDILVARSFMWAQKKWNSFWEVDKASATPINAKSQHSPNVSTPMSIELTKTSQLN